VVHKIPYPTNTGDNFPLAPPDGLVMERGMEMLQTNVQNGELVVLRATTMRWAITATTRSIRAIGPGSAREHRGQADDHFLEL